MYNRFMVLTMGTLGTINPAVGRSFARAWDNFDSRDEQGERGEITFGTLAWIGITITLAIAVGGILLTIVKSKASGTKGELDKPINEAPVG